LSANGITRFGISREDINRTFLPVPPIHIQERISDYLDAETARIDELILEKEGLLALQAEKKRALIARTVLHGLEEAAPVKDSGVSWLGPIPAHWQVHRLNTLFTERDERDQPDLPLLNVSLRTGVTERRFEDDRIERVSADFSTYKVARQGDIVFNKMRMWQGAVGVAPIDGLVSPDYVVAYPTVDLAIAYFGLLFKLPAMSAEFARNSHGIVWDRLRLYWEGFRDVRVPFPPLPEQRAVAQYLETETRAIDALRRETEGTVRLLGERRSALIAAAVTGQIPVGEPACY